MRAVAAAVVALRVVVAGAAGDGAPPAGPGGRWVLPASLPVRVYSYRGYWHPYFRLDSALARLGGAEEHGPWFGPTLPVRPPAAPEQFSRYHLLVAGYWNDPGWTDAVRGQVRTYVEQGGALLLLGGIDAFGIAYRGTDLEAVSPLTAPGTNGPTLVREGLRLEAGPALGEIWPGGGTGWDAAPRVYWVHEVAVKPGARVLLTAGGRPLLAVWRCGRGSAAAFAGTVMGDPGPGQTGWWDWAAWPDLAGAVVGWLLAHPEGKDGTAAADLSAWDAALRSAGGQASAEAGVLSNAVASCRDAALAGWIVRVVASRSRDLGEESADAAFLAVAPFAEAVSEQEVFDLLDPRHVNRTVLGLRLLGRAGGAGARDALLSALARGDVPERRREDAEASLEGLLDDLEGADQQAGLGQGMGLDPGDGFPREVAERARDVRLAALEGLGMLGSPEAIPVLREFRGRLARPPAPAAGAAPVPPAADEELYDQATAALLLCGEASAAGEFADVFLAQRYRAVGLYCLSWQQKTPVAQAALRGPAGRLVRRLWRTCMAASRLPMASRSALATRIAVERDPWIAPLAWSALGANAGGGAGLPPEPAARLRASPVEAVRLLKTGKE